VHAVSVLYTSPSSTQSSFAQTAAVKNESSYKQTLHQSSLVCQWTGPSEQDIPAAMQLHTLNAFKLQILPRDGASVFFCYRCLAGISH
jgi:hypothetical protein